ncbi:MAG: helix-turn-helix transcriptional regulator, partial [Bacteroidales bacterium]|nr:helix-turn-helix transcriptional regulator [Bacteroidales bacterium]
MFSMTVFDYVNDLRMNKAARLIAENQLSISAIAIELGFSSHSHFCTAFRKKFGLTPKEFRDVKSVVN